MATPIDVKCSDIENEALVAAGTHCQICLKEASKYTCPRCNVAYCSVSCYKDEKHINCSESFYKDCVITQLQDMTNSDDDKKKVMEMLTRDLEEKADEETEAQDEDNEQQSLADRLEGLDLDKDVSAVWAQLSSKEKEDFARMLEDGRLARLIELWVPWWKCPKNMSLIKDDNGATRQENEVSKVPSTLGDIPDINNLLKSNRPSSDCRFDLINILFAYAYVARIHNGDIHECPVDSSQLLLDASVVLSGECRCGSVGEAIQYSLDAVGKNGSKLEEKTSSSLSSSSGEFGLTVLEDVIALLSGPGTSGHTLGFMVAALSDVTALLRKSLTLVKKELKSNKDQDESLKVLKSQVFKAEKKSVFFLSWLQRYGMGAHPLMPLLQLEIERRQSDLQEVGELKDCVEKNMNYLKPKKRGRSKGKEDKVPSPGNCGRKIVEL